MTGDDFISALAGRIPPAAIVSMRGDASGVDFILSNGEIVSAKRKKIAALKTDGQCAAYLDEVLG